MPITHAEIRDSRKGKDSVKRASVSFLKYQLWGSDDIDEMRDYLDNTPHPGLGTSTLVPGLYDGLIYEDLDREPLGPAHWRWSARYVEPRRSDESNDKLEVGEYRLSYDTTGGRLKIYWTPDHTNRVTKFPAAATDHKGAIEVRHSTKGPEPQGAEIVIPVLKFQIHYRRAKDATEAAWINFMKTVATGTGRTNDATFKTFAGGEVLSLGGNGQQGIDSDPVVDFHFAAQPNLTGLIYDAITGVAKDGHDFLWIEYEPEKDGTTNAIRPKPIGVYVHQLYEPWDFSQFGVGT